MSGFAKAALAGEVETALAYVDPEGHDYEDIGQALTLPAGVLRQLLAHAEADEAIDVRIDNQTEDGCTFHWRITFKEEFSIEGDTFKAGDTFDLDGNLNKVGHAWLIEVI